MASGSRTRPPSMDSGSKNKPPSMAPSSRTRPTSVAASRGNMSMIEFLKMYSTIPNKFMDDMLSFYDENTSQTDFVVDLDRVAKWLDVERSSLMITLPAQYQIDVDYQVIPMPRRQTHGGQLKKLVLLTPDCFKRICMRSRTSKGEEVRSYFLQLESLVMKYRARLVDSLRDDLARLERNQAGSPRLKAGKDGSGFIYILRAGKGTWKVGKTTDVARRMRQHNTPLADNVELVFLFETDSVDEVEGCVKSWLSEETYRVGREIYKTNVDVIKQVINGCDGIGGIKRHAIKRAANAALHKSAGEEAVHFVAILKDTR